MSPLPVILPSIWAAFSVKKTLEGHGLTVLEGDGEDLDGLYANICKAINTPGPVAVINKRKMAVGIEGIEGSTHGHDVIPVDAAIKYLEAKGRTEAADILKKHRETQEHLQLHGIFRQAGF